MRRGVRGESDVEYRLFFEALRKAREFRSEEERIWWFREQAGKEDAVQDSKRKSRIVDSLRVPNEVGGNMTP